MRQLLALAASSGGRRRKGSGGGGGGVLVLPASAFDTLRTLVVGATISDDTATGVDYAGFAFCLRRWIPGLTMLHAQELLAGLGVPTSATGVDGLDFVDALESLALRDGYSLVAGEEE